MKRRISIAWLLMLTIWLFSCSQQTLSQPTILFITTSTPTPRPIPPTATSTPPPRPISEYDLGIWHYQIATEMADYVNTVLTNIGEPINIEIEIFPATSLNDDVIIIKREKWPENADLGQVIYWLFGCIFTESERYNLAPKGVIMVEYLMKPFGDFQFDDNNIRGFCDIPWDAIITFVGHSGQDLSNNKQFANAWDCAYH